MEYMYKMFLCVNSENNTNCTKWTQNVLNCWNLVWQHRLSNYFFATKNVSTLATK